MDKEGTPPQDCPNWALSSDALNQLNISEPEFDINYSTGEEDPREEKKKRKVKHKQSKKGASVKKDSKRKGADMGGDVNVLYKRRKRTERGKSPFLPSPEAAITATRTTTTSTPAATTRTTAAIATGTLAATTRTTTAMTKTTAATATGTLAAIATKTLAKTVTRTPTVTTASTIAEILPTVSEDTLA